MEHGNNKHITPYSTYLIVWVALLAFTSITVSVAGINLGNLTLFVALVIAAIKSAMVINIFMHIKFEEKIFKVFLLLSGMTLLVIFLLTFTDFSFR